VRRVDLTIDKLCYRFINWNFCY